MFESQYPDIETETDSPASVSVFIPLCLLNAAAFVILSAAAFVILSVSEGSGVPLQSPLRQTDREH